MPLNPRPDWEPLPDPPPPDPELGTEFQVLAEELMPIVDAEEAVAGEEVALVFADADAHELAVDVIGADLAAAADEIAAALAEAEVDTLEPELVAADEQDAAVETTAAELAVFVGETPPGEPPEPGGDPGEIEVPDPIPVGD